MYILIQTIPKYLYWTGFAFPNQSKNIYSLPPLSGRRGDRRLTRILPVPICTCAQPLEQFVARRDSNPRGELSGWPAAQCPDALTN